MFRERMSRGKAVMGGVVAGMIGGASMEASAAPTPDLHEQHIEGEAPRIGDLSLDLYAPLLHVDGTTSWSEIGGRLLEPAYVDIGRERARPETVSFVVPYEYARLFDTGNPLSPEDYDAAKAWMATEVRRDLANDLYALPWDKAHYENQTGFREGSGLVVDTISITGLTSPEAHGAASVAVGTVDNANLALGEARAEDALTRLLDVLNAQGIDVSQATSAVDGDEIQFTPAEFARLKALAESKGIRGADNDEVYRLISQYNSGHITDIAVQGEMDQIVGSKRQVQVEVTFKSGEKDHILLPLPLLALLLLRRRGSDVAPTPVVPAEKRPQIWNTVPDKMKDSRQTAVDVEADLTKNFNYYQPVVDPYIARKDWDLNEMTHDILEAWNATDNPRRRAMGQPESDHKQNPRQVYYAYLHAVALRELTKEAQAKAPNTPLSEAWKDPAIRNKVGAAIIKESDYLAKLNNKKFEA